MHVLAVDHACVLALCALYAKARSPAPFALMNPALLYATAVLLTVAQPWNLHATKHHPAKRSALK